MNKRTVTNNDNKGWNFKTKKTNIIVGTSDNPTKFKSGETIINKKSTKKNLEKLIEINNDVNPDISTGKTTTDATAGGLLKGKPHYDKDGNATGGIPGVVEGGKPIETEGDEFVVNAEASKKHWQELSKINQEAGNGVPIGPPTDSFDDDPEEEFEGGGKIQFNPNYLPSKWIMSYAKKIKSKHPEIWKLGGNIFGNEAFENLKRVSERGYWLDSEEWMYVKWRSYVARHKQDFRIEGVVAMLKWVDKVDKGWAYMKNLIEEEIKKKSSKKMVKGGGVDTGAKKFIKWYIDWFKELSDKMNIYFSLPNSIDSFKEKNVVIMDLFEKIDQNIDAKKYLKEIIKQADEFDVTIYLEPTPRYKYFLNNVSKRQKISKEYLISYYEKFGFDLTSNKQYMKRLPNNPDVRYATGGGVDMDVNKLLGRFVNVFVMGVSEPEYFKIKEVKITPEQYRYRDVVLRGDVGVTKFPLDKLDDFIAGKEILIQDANEDYAIQLTNESYATGGSTKNYVTYKDKYNRKYNYPKNTSHSLEQISKDSGVSMKGLQQIYNKGIGAYKTNPSSIRPNVTSKEQWAMARVYSAVMGGKASDVDSNELKMSQGGKQIKYTEGGKVISDNVNAKLEFMGFVRNPNNYLMGKKINENLYIQPFYDKNKGIYKIRGVNKFKTSLGENSIGVKFDFENENNFFDKINELSNQMFAEGGNVSQEINCQNCGWHWNTNQSEEFDKYVCHKCNFDNSPFYSKGSLIAPNGKSSNLTPEQYKLVRTPEFKAWFGDWENDPGNASKVVDENGEPLVVFHGTDKKFNVFKKINQKFDNENYVSGMWFFSPPIGQSLTPQDREYFYDEGSAEYMAESWTENGFVLKCFLKVINPIEVDDYDRFLSEVRFGYMDEAIKNGQTDGYIIHGSLTDGNVYRDDINVFEPNQIKLADGTNITFDGNNPDIRFAAGGNVDKQDTVTMDIPLLIRTLELVREDVHSDPDLHFVVENLLHLKNKKVLTMEDYAFIADIEHKNFKKYATGGNVTIGKKDVSIGFGSLGSGTTVWDRNRIEHGDYKIIAHISDFGKITFYDNKLPETAIAQIEEFASKETQRLAEGGELSQGYDFSPIQTPLN